ncbi:OmpA family protein [Mycoplana dimorpha]|uniref:Outer membrane protein OmpA-like peptidoglycan-associated protein n=1 Tax=Mycoplana dimorpha TaxID=28320 RepID=A0A2T5ATV0_MYCDI|nr:OmpA family protein [Mycoplana dimorpha]PTM90140.1 outer membrane protein OmpA-like peptidoglycan-associated protein [Mycoplana dimorpha]
MSTAETATKVETKGYNRGLILGFTMAESMLLLVFCLLLMTGAIIANERLKANNAVKEVARLEDTLKKKEKDLKVLETKLTALSGQISLVDKRKLEEDWRELVEAREAVKALKEQGVERDKIDELAKGVAVLMQKSIDVSDPERLKERIDALLAAENALNDQRRLEEELKAALARGKDLEVLLANAESELEKTQQTSKPHEWPPIISLSEASGYFFRSGSAELTEKFTSDLNGSISAQIADNLKRYGVDIVEVIGHTDEQPLSRLNSNMDKLAIEVLALKKPVTAMGPADNAGLGLARAISVANVLRGNGALEGVTILPLSAAQLVMPGDKLTTGQAGNVETRRRIEIRIRRRDNSVLASE